MSKTLAYMKNHIKTLDPPLQQRTSLSKCDNTPQRLIIIIIFICWSVCNDFFLEKGSFLGCAGVVCY